VPLSSQSELATTDITHWDEQGLGVGNVTGRLSPADTVVVVTQVDGPRTDVNDVVKYWVDRWGAPVRVRDPLDYETLLSRGDANAPALITRAQFADGRILGAVYDSRGNLSSVADSTFEGSGTTQTIVTSFVYGNSGVPDSPTQIRAPKDTARFIYDTTLGVPDTVIAPGGHRTRFEYFTSGAKKGLLYRITELSVAVVDTTTWLKANAPTLVTQLAYDAWGNDSAVTSPKGNQTRYERDAYRRISSVFDGMNHQTSFAYDSLNRRRSATVIDPRALATKYFYSINSAVDSVLDPRSVNRTWVYDSADRPVMLRDEAHLAEQRFFNRAGLVDSLVTRAQEVIRNRYDLAGRLIATIYPRRIYGPTFNYSGSDTIPGDSIARQYDPIGRLTTIARSNSTISRTYNREGTLRTERQIMRDALGAIISDVTMLYWYDAGSRRVKFFNGTDTLRYTYGPDGLLSILAVQWGTSGVPLDTFRFYWDGLGRRDSVKYSMGTTVAFGRDAGGVLRMVCSKHPGNPYDNDFLEQRLWYDSVNADGLVTHLRRYGGGPANSSCANSGIGSTQLEATTVEYDTRHEVVRGATQRYDYDSSGNRIALRTLSFGLVDSLSYQGRRNRINQTFGPSGQLMRNYFYGPDGTIGSETTVPALTQDRLYYYNPLGELTGTRWVYTFVYNPSTGQYDPVWAGGATRCVYDALGRRTNTCGGGGGGILGFDGDNVVRAGGTWRYVQGPGLDDPLVAVQMVGSARKLYYLTDGRGRHLAFTDSIGTNYMSTSGSGLEYTTYYQNGGNQAGSIENSHGFDNIRGASDNAPQLSYYRNRYYDQKTGRFISEDPIGIAGGVNLYQYSGNSPASFTDPFGLKVCFSGTRYQIKQLSTATKNATGTDFALDSDNCVIEGSLRSRGHEELAGIQAEFMDMVKSPDTFTFAFTRIYTSRQIHRFRIDAFTNYSALAYSINANGKCGGAHEPWDLNQVIAHEMYHHAPVTRGLPMDPDENKATDQENAFNRFAGRPIRCAY
jgi:RHS repeat-associated protein